MYSLIEPPPSTSFQERVAQQFHEAITEANHGVTPLPHEIPLLTQTYVLESRAIVKFTDGETMVCPVGTHVLAWKSPQSDEPLWDYAIAIVCPRAGETID
jgi:hypothetical protein